MNVASTFKGRYRTNGTRLQGWDYASTAMYMVTICTDGRYPYFGKKGDNKIILSDIGHRVVQYWMDIPVHHPHVVLDHFIVMPDHMHGIILIKKLTKHVNHNHPNHPVSNDPLHNGVVHGGLSVHDNHNHPNHPVSNDPLHNGVVHGGLSVEAGHGLPLQTTTPTQEPPHLQWMTDSNHVPHRTIMHQYGRIKRKFGHVQPRSLSIVINQFKGAVTRWCRKNGYEHFAWQSNFHEKMIRSKHDLIRARRYVDQNPMRE